MNGNIFKSYIPKEEPFYIPISESPNEIDIGKEALYVMMEALNILGDEFGVYAFDSDEGIVMYRIIKNFNENYTSIILSKLNKLKPSNYTRLGGAIRHTTRKLLEESNSKTKMMIIISDGYPEGEGYW